MTARILVVDDEKVARVSLADILRLEGYKVSTAASGLEALKELAISSGGLVEGKDIQSEAW